MNGCGDSCTCLDRQHSGVSSDGRWICKAKKCPHSISGGGCKLGKVSLTCDDNTCKWNTRIQDKGIYVCLCMDIHLDADGKCLGRRTTTDDPKD